MFGFQRPGGYGETVVLGHWATGPRYAVYLAQSADGLNKELVNWTGSLDGSLSGTDGGNAWKFVEAVKQVVTIVREVGVH